MAELDNSLVKRGFWINHANGVVLGATVTTTPESANVIVASIAVLVALAGPHLWNIMVFIYHQCRADRPLADGLYRQQQVLLRGMLPPGSMFTESVKLLIAWRKLAPRAITRTLVPMIAALLMTLAILSAGVFSSYIVNFNNLEVLVHSDSCAAWNMTSPLAPFQDSSARDYTHLAAAYARDCYFNSTKIPSQCNVFVKSAIDFSSTYEACPFGPSICDGFNMSALVIDTGQLDSRDDFGINTKDKDRVKIRKRTSCLPIDVTKRTTVIDAYGKRLFWYHPFQGESAWLYNLSSIHDSARGPGMNGVTDVFGTAETNTTDKYSTFGRFYSGSLELRRDHERGDLIPIPDLVVEHRDTSIVYIVSNGVTSAHPINDPVFASHKVVHFTNTQCLKEEQCQYVNYLPDHPAGVVACTEEYQYCTNDGSGTRCSPWTESVFDRISEKVPWANEIQLTVLGLFANASYWYSIDKSATPEVAMLDASTGLIDGVVGGLPINQWEREVLRFEAFVWASVQQHITKYAIGAAAEDDPISFVSPSTDTEKQLCGLIKMRKLGGFANVNVFGLSFIVAVSILVILTETILLKALVLIPCVRRRFAPRLDEWIGQSMFQLQRRVYESRGEGTWSSLDREVPVTTSYLLLSSLENNHLPNTIATAISSPATVSSPSSTKSHLDHMPVLPGTVSTLPALLPVQVSPTTSSTVSDQSLQPDLAIRNEASRESPSNEPRSIDNTQDALN